MKNKRDLQGKVVGINLFNKILDEYQILDIDQYNTSDIYYCLPVYERSYWENDELLNHNMIKYVFTNFIINIPDLTQWTSLPEIDRYMLEQTYYADNIITKDRIENIQLPPNIYINNFFDHIDFKLNDKKFEDISKFSHDICMYRWECEHNTIKIQWILIDILQNFLHKNNDDTDMMLYGDKHGYGYYIYRLLDINHNCEKWNNISSDERNLYMFLQDGYIFYLKNMLYNMYISDKLLLYELLQNMNKYWLSMTKEQQLELSIFSYGLYAYGKYIKCNAIIDENIGLNPYITSQLVKFTIDKTKNYDLLKSLSDNNINLLQEWNNLSYNKKLLMSYIGIYYWAFTIFVKNLGILHLIPKNTKCIVTTNNINSLKKTIGIRTQTCIYQTYLVKRLIDYVKI